MIFVQLEDELSDLFFVCYLLVYSAI